MKLLSENAEVQYIKDYPVKIQKDDFDTLYESAKESNRNRARYCAHETKESDLHDMFEIFTINTYLRPIKQKNKNYSYHIIRGSVDVYLFTDDGSVTQIISLGDFDSGKPFYFRPPVNVYRTLITRSDFVLYHETTTGPFKREDSLFAPWAPEESDHSGVTQFISTLKTMSKN